MPRPISFVTACAQYIHRFTMEHVPAWAQKPHIAGEGLHAGKSMFYAPQFRTDAEWYANTKFHGESELATDTTCYTSGQTWPMGNWLSQPFKVGQK